MTICKYCLDEIVNTEDIVCPCDCVTPVHKKCIYKWIYFKNNNYETIPRRICEICRKRYNIDIYKEDTIHDKTIFILFLLIAIIYLIILCYCDVVYPGTYSNNSFYFETVLYPY